jgi:hypothetical protein
MLSRLRILAVSVIAASTIVTSAHAACTQAQLAGRWKAYSAGVDNQFSYWTSCTIIINATGFIANTTCINSFNFTGNLTQGRIVLGHAPTCAFNGGFTFAGERNTLRNMTLSLDKQTAAGVGVFPGGSFIFSMVRM